MNAQKNRSQWSGLGTNFLMPSVAPKNAFVSSDPLPYAGMIQIRFKGLRVEHPFSAPNGAPLVDEKRDEIV
jgi:hypothetical protein